MIQVRWQIFASSRKWTVVKSYEQNMFLTSKNFLITRGILLDGIMGI